MKKMKLRFIEEQKGMSYVPDFIYDWVKTFDGATIEFSEIHLKIIPIDKVPELGHPFPLLTSLHKSKEEKYIKSGPLISDLEIENTDNYTKTYLGHFENGWKFRFIIKSSLIEILNNLNAPTLEKAVCIADYKPSGWAIFFDITTFH